MVAIITRKHGTVGGAITDTFDHRTQDLTATVSMRKKNSADTILIG
jgi:hypothetical protein